MRRFAPAPSAGCRFALVAGLGALWCAAPVPASPLRPPQPARVTPVSMSRPAPAAASLPLAPPLLRLQVSSPYGPRIDPVTGRRSFHQGVDYAAPEGTPIHAACDGVIEVIDGRPGFGYYVRMRHAAGVETAYGHLYKFMPGLRRGSVLRKGDVIGFVGATGRATGTHLHYEVIVGGRAINPSGG